MARRAIRRATPPPTAGGSAYPHFLAFCPSDLPVRKSGSGTRRTMTVQRLSDSRAYVETEGRHRSFCELGCGLAAQEVEILGRDSTALMRLLGA
jgi:hypothetical protein